MTDFRSVEELGVFRDGARVGNLRRLPKGCEFRYTDAFLASNQRAVALHLPKSGDGIRVEGIANLPTYFAGLLPEGVMFAAVRTAIGSAADDLFAVLAATGADAVGDVEVRVPGAPERAPLLDLAEAVELAKTLDGRRVAAISGVQPKFSLGELVRVSRKSTYIAKFEPAGYPGLVANEYAFMRLARRCRLDAAEVRLESGALVVKRFDRRAVPGEKRLHQIHQEDMLQAMDLYPHSKYTHDYAELLRKMEELGVAKATLLDALRLYVFSYLIGNGDLHEKNVSLMFDAEDGQWRLSPAYDLLSTLPYGEVLPGADRMALALNDEAVGRFTVGDFVAFGLRFGLPERAVTGMIERTAQSVRRFAPEVLGRSVAEEVLETIAGRCEALEAA